MVAAAVVVVVGVGNAGMFVIVAAVVVAVVAVEAGVVAVEAGVVVGVDFVVMYQYWLIVTTVVIIATEAMRW